MRRFLTPPTVLLFLVLALLGACARPAPEADTMQPGTQVTVTLKDGSSVRGRLVQTKPDALVVDPTDGGEWKTVPRGEVASVAAEQATAVPPSPAPAPASTEPQPPAGAASREVTIPANTVLHVRLDTAVASDTSRAEDRIQASLARPVLVKGAEAAPAGSALKGVVTEARRSGRVSGRAAVAFRFDTLVVGGDDHRVKTRTVAVEAPGTKRNDALKIGAPAAGGAILGGILGGKKGALAGGAIGGGAGTAVVMSTRGKQVRLPSGSAVTVKLLAPVTVRIAADR
jgi:hypothetical protein